MPPLILVADDEPDIRDLLATLLGDEGYRVHCVHDGQQLLDHVAVESPDLIVSDVRMPRVDGLELIRRLRAAGVGVPVILISAHHSAACQPGVRFVPKPFDLAHLAGVVSDALATGVA